MCSGKTKPECFQYRVSGLPMGKLEDVKKIQPGVKLFLYDFDLKLLYGIYESTSYGQLNLEPMAFAGRFPLQVQFRIFMDCLPVPEIVFKHAIKENYYSSSRFRQDLHINQSRVEGVQSVAERQYYIQEVAHVHSNQKLQGSHPPYVPEDTRLSVTDTYGRVAVAAEMVSVQQDVGYVSRHYTSDQPRGTPTGARLNHVVNYHSQQAPPASVSYASVSAATLSYGPVQPPYHAHWKSSSSSYQPYYTETTPMVQAQSYGTVPLAANTLGSANGSNEASALFSSQNVFSGDPST